MGVWIEISSMPAILINWSVTPYVGVWIEIFQSDGYIIPSMDVTPYVGVWIEIS